MDLKLSLSATDSSNLAKNPLLVLLEKEIQTIYDEKIKLLKNLPKIILEAHTADLKKVMECQIQKTEMEILSLQELTDELKLEIKGKKSPIINSFVKEIKEILKEGPGSAFRDTSLISIFQKIISYEIACYKIAKTYADELELKNQVNSFNQLLEEENTIHMKYISIAEGGFFSPGVNIMASGEQI